MNFPIGGAARTTAEKVATETYDVVIVGAGISGAILAKELGDAGKRVLILEAGKGGDRNLTGYDKYLRHFYGALSKDNQAPYPENANVPMPRSTDAVKITPGIPDTNSGYLVQTGPFCNDTTYTRVMGGTTMHWEAKILRMLPEDFEMRTQFGRGVDWPLKYEDLDEYYQLAEQEIGISADKEDQEYLGVKFPKDYVFPMHKMPLSWLDQQVGKGIDGTKVTVAGHEVQIQVRSFPQGRNGIPNRDYVSPKGKKGYVPVGAVNTIQAFLGGRCQGNNNCVPLCPVQAKYNANKTLAKALQNANVHLLPQSVASKVDVDANGRVTQIEFKQYQDSSTPGVTTHIAKGKVYVLATNAIENPRLMLASGLNSSSNLMGRNFMDHAYLLSWALMPQVCGTFRGTNCTGGICDLRGGPFRNQLAAFAVDIHNDGWAWAAGSPLSDLDQMIDNENLFGRDLRRALADRLTRQLQLAFMIEVLPSESNRVSVDPAYRDQLGNMRPIISYTVPEYTMRGVQEAREFAKTVFRRLGASDHTNYDPGDYGYVTYEGEGYSIRGGNHLAGTHTMGCEKSKSVVNPDQRSWDHANLYLVGGGSMPTIGTANVTLTIAALCYKTSRAIFADLAQQ